VFYLRLSFDSRNGIFYKPNMSQRISSEPPWQSWNTRIADHAVPQHILSSLGVVSTDQFVPLPLYVHEQPSKVVGDVKKTKKKKTKRVPVDFKVAEPQSSEISFPKVKSFPVFVRSGYFQLNYTGDELRLYAQSMDYDPDARIKVLQYQQDKTYGFIRRVSRLLRWKFGFDLMEIYASCIGFSFREDRLSLHERSEGSFLCSRDYEPTSDPVLQQIQLFVEFYYNFDIVGKEKLGDIPHSPLYVLSYALRYIVFYEDGDVPELVDNMNFLALSAKSS